MSPVEDDLISVGHIIGAHGVRGQIKVFSHTSPRENIVTYSPWVVQQGEARQSFKVKGRRQGKNVIASLEGVMDRNQAMALTGATIWISQKQLPKLKQGEYYWSQLLGLQVISAQGFDFGSVDQMMETGANDVMVVQGERERLIPFVIDEVIKSVDLEKGQIIVDWDNEF